MTKKAQKDSGRSRLVDARQKFGEHLKQMRKAQGLTGQQLAGSLGIGQAAISKVENGRQAVTVDYLARFAKALGLSRGAAQRLLDEFNRLPSARAPEILIPFSTFDFLRADDVESRQREVAALEREASVVRLFQPHMIPGILQTDQYAQSVIRLAGHDNREAIERGVLARRARRRALEHKKEFRFVITEGALRTRVCSNACMIEQLERLQGLARRPNISLSVLPWSARPSALLLSSFYIYDERAVYIELTHGELNVYAATEVQLYLKRYSDFERAALTGVDAIAALGRIVQDFRRLEDVERGLSPTVV